MSYKQAAELATERAELIEGALRDVLAELVPEEESQFQARDKAIAILAKYSKTKTT